ncbi:MAG: YfiR family protein [Sedimentisphaerales bacterium]|nr:YfiR family protein [Sedimentisphaerales bacterium]
MRPKIYILAIVTICMLQFLHSAPARAETASVEEYKMKAAFLYNFAKFVDWPNDKTADANKPISISIVGKDPFGKVFEPIEKKPIKGRKIVIKRFKSFKEIKESGREVLDRQIDAMRKSHIMFLCSSESEAYDEIIKALNNHPILTVADRSGFIEVGGIVNFATIDKKVRFEINAAAAKKKQLKIRSQLLRLASKVIQ